MPGHDTLPERKLFPQHYYATYVPIDSSSPIQGWNSFLFCFEFSYLYLYVTFTFILCLSQEEPSLLNSIFYAYLASTNSGSSVRLISDSLIYLLPRWVSIFFVWAQSWSVVCSLLAEMSRLEIARMPQGKWDGEIVWTKWTWDQENWNSKKQFSLRNGLRQPAYYPSYGKMCHILDPALQGESESESFRGHLHFFFKLNPLIWEFLAWKNDLRWFYETSAFVQN